MQYNNRAILAMVASAINPKSPDVHAHHSHISYHAGLTEIDTTPDRNALILYMDDGREFQITVEEVV